MASVSSPAWVHTAIRVEPIAGCGDRLWSASMLEPVQTLVDEFGVVNRAAGHDVGGATVLVYARPDVRAVGGRVRDVTVATSLDNHAPAAFSWPPFDPIG